MKTPEEIWASFYAEAFKEPYNKYRNQALNVVGATKLIALAQADGYRAGIEAAAKIVENGKAVIEMGNARVVIEKLVGRIRSLLTEAISQDGTKKGEAE